MSLPNTILNQLDRLGACAESKAWVYAHPTPNDLQALWQTCPSGYWLTWLLSYYGTEDEAGFAAALEERAGRFNDNGSAFAPVVRLHWPHPPESIVRAFEGCWDGTGELPQSLGAST